jgi:hypothetical protein|nr:MAG TPA: hypothetical protein [Caudoviricetes sp.]
MQTPPTYSEALNIAAAAYAEDRRQSCPYPRLQEEQRVRLLQAIHSNALVGIALIDWKEHPAIYAKAKDEYNRSGDLLDVLQERAKKELEQIAAEELAAAQTPEGRAFFDECLQRASKYPRWTSSRFGRVMADEDNPNAPANPCGTLGYYLARIAHDIVNKNP